jgi:hypothetical protein
MKIFGFAFSFYLLLLALHPGIVAIAGIAGQKMETCCSDSCEPLADEQPKDEDCTNTATCNPFEICQNCTTVADEFHPLVSAPTIILSSPYIQNKEKVPPRITIDFWQPPKIA